MSSVTVNLAGIEQLQRAMREMERKSLQVGWFESANYEDGTPVAGVAALQELGSKTAPPRPFFRPAIEDNKEKWSNLVADGARAVTEGNANIDQVMNGLGLMVVGDVKNAIAGPHLALSPVTLALRKLRNDGHTVGKGLVGAVAGAIARGETGAGQLGNPSGNTTPLNETGYMIATLTSEVS